jgi:flagellar protein FliS
MPTKDFETEYLKREIEGKTNLEIVVMMYDAGLKFMNRAVEFIEEKNIEKTHYNIVKAQNIVNELLTMLDMEKGGEISENLNKLYLFISDRLTTANIKKEPKPLKEAIEIFAGLRESWLELAKKEKNELAGNTEKNETITKQKLTKPNPFAKQSNNKPRKSFSIKG